MNDWRWLMVAVWLPALHVVATVTLSLWTRFVCHLLRAWSFDRHESITSKYMHATIKNCWNTSLNFVVTLAIATTRRKQYRLAKPSINRPRHCQSTPHNNDSNSYVRHRINRIFARAHRRNISFDLTDGRWSFGWLCRNRTHRHYKKNEMAEYDMADVVVIAPSPCQFLNRQNMLYWRYMSVHVNDLLFCCNKLPIAVCGHILLFVVVAVVWTRRCMVISTPTTSGCRVSFFFFFLLCFTCACKCV